MTSQAGVLLIEGLEKAPYLETEAEIVELVDRFSRWYRIPWRNRIDRLLIVFDDRFSYKRGTAEAVGDRSVRITLHNVQRRSADSLLKTLVHELSHVRDASRYGLELLERGPFSDKIDYATYRRLVRADERSEPRAKRTAFFWMLWMKIRRLFRSLLDM